jgi:hypothetical protein
LFVLCDRGEVHRTGLSPLFIQLNAKHRSLERHGVCGQLDSTPTSTIQNPTLRKAVLRDESGSNACDLPRCGEWLAFAGMMEDHAIWSGRVLRLFHQSFG